MGDVLTKGSLFPEELVTELINKVKGKSSLARMSAAEPIPFNGVKEFTFTLDKEIDVVAESGAKSKGGMTVSPITIVPIKVEYSARVSDEFKYATDTVKLDYLRAFADGFAKKVAKGIDIMAFHGYNPRTGSASAVIGDNHFDHDVSQKVSMTYGTTADANVEAAIALIQAQEHDASGMVMAPSFRSALAAMTKTNGEKVFPELAWGNAPSSLNGLPVDSNPTVNFNSNVDRAIIGDFTNMFKWGYAKEIPLEIIEYGNPDNDAILGDLKGHNQVLLRSEAYIGWGILDAAAFALIQENKFTLSFNANTGTGTMPGGSYIPQTPVVMPVNSFTAPASKTFKEFNTAADGSGTGYDPAESFTMPAANTTLYAIWQS